MEDANRIFAVRQITESEFAIKCAGAAVEDFGWGKAAVVPGFADCPGAASVTGLVPGEFSDVESALKSASKFFKSHGAREFGVHVSPDLLDAETCARIEEDMYLLDYRKTGSGIYAWVKSKKAEKKPPVEISRAAGMEEAISLFDGEAGCTQALRMSMHKIRDEKLAGYATWLAKMNGEPVGRLAYFNFGVCGRLRSLFVAPDRRRSGVATALLDHHIGIAREQGNVVIGLITEKDNPARYLFTGAGFSKIGDFWTFEGPVL